MPSYDYLRDIFEKYVAELAGPSRDRPIRSATEQMILHFLHILDSNDQEAARPYFSENPTIILGLSEPGDIYVGMDDIDVLFDDKAETQLTVPKLVIVDRGRVTCHLVTFLFKNDQEDDESATFSELSSIVIFDLDDSSKIARMEIRQVKDNEKRHKGGRMVFELFAKQAEESAIVIDYNS